MEQSSRPTWKENRTLGTIVLCAVVLLSVVGIGGGKVQKIAADVNNFYAQTMGGTYGELLNAADSIIQVGQKALEPADATLVAARQTWESAAAATMPKEQCEAVAALQTKIGFLYETLHAQMNAEKGGVLQTQWSEFRDASGMLTYAAGAYNEKAAAAQKKLRGFPGSLLMAISGASVSQYQ